MEGLGSETASYKQFKIIGIASGVRDKIVFSRSSSAIWCVSRSESFEREVKIFCFSSTIAKWEDSDEDLEDGVDWVWGFVFFILGGCELECE